MSIRRDWSQYILNRKNEQSTINDPSLLCPTESFDLRLPDDPKLRSRLILKEISALIPVIKEVISKLSEISQVQFGKKILSATLRTFRKFTSNQCASLLTGYICGSNMEFIHQIVYFIQHECYLYISDIEHYIGILFSFIETHISVHVLVKLSLILIRVYQVWIKYTIQFQNVIG